MSAMSSGDSDDLAQLESLDEEKLVRALHSRYQTRQIYTYVGDILIAVNPYADLGIYGQDYTQLYTKVVAATVPPHVFAVADVTFSSLVRTSRSQVCVVSGESGAGKTESTKLLIKHILSRCSGSQIDLHNKIEMMSPILEGFGNAQTVMNKNSSRFGKFLEITFDSHGGVTGGLVTEYLLERSRVVEHSEGERSFHVFYYFVAGLTEVQRGRLCLPTDARFKCLGSASRGDDSARWQEVITALITVGFSANDVEDVVSLLAASLHCCELKFVSTEDEGSIITNAPVGELVAQLLALNEGDLVSALTSKVTTFRNEQIIKKLTARQATDSSKAIAKALYGRLFSWIVKRINSNLASGSGHATSVGLLDIFGFENFETNSFEQVCINLANEKLQFYFNEHIFRQELDEYKAEGLGSIALSYADNTSVLELLTKRPLSIMSILDEESRLQSATDSSFIQKMAQHLESKAGKLFKCGTSDFQVIHYAGAVKYRISGFIHKNRDELPELVGVLLAASLNSLVSSMFGSTGGEVVADSGPASRPSRRGVSRRGKSRKSMRPPRSKKKIPTVGAQFVASLDTLIAKMTQAEPHFVRCIKPNREAAANSWNDALVLEQLKYTGMLETVRIRREGYAVRLKFADFIDRYYGIAFDFTKRPAVSAANVEKILEKAGLQGYLVGKTKVFLKYFHASALLERLEIFATNALRVQTWLRRVLCMQILKRLLAVSRAEAASASVFVLDLTAASNKLFHLIDVTDAEDERRAADKQVAGESDLDMSTLTPKPVFPEGPVRVPEPGTKAHIKHTTKQEKESMKWFRGTQREKVTKTGGPLNSNAVKKRKAMARRSVSPWFHGILNRERAENQLARTPNGTFLIRIAQERLGYSISLVWDDSFRHFPIYEDGENRFSLDQGQAARRFLTLPELVAHYRDNDITATGHERLITPLTEVPVPTPAATGEEDVTYVELVWDEKLAKRRMKTGVDDAAAGPPTPTPASKFVASQLAHDKRQAINNQTVLSIEEKFGQQQNAADHTYLPKGVNSAQGAPKVLLRTHTQIMKQKDMIADAERRILQARAEWRRQKKADEMLAKQQKKATKSKQKKKPKGKGKNKSEPPAAGPTVVDLEGGYPALPTGDGKSHDYRSLHGILREVHMLPP